MLAPIPIPGSRCLLNPESRMPFLSMAHPPQAALVSQAPVVMVMSDHALPNLAAGGEGWR
jgi:hypothetical protein